MTCKLFLNLKKIVISFVVFFALLIVVSCDAETIVELKADGCVSISFNGATGAAFTKMISAAVGESENAVFDVREINYEMSKAGFSKVKVQSPKGTDINITMNDEKQKTFLFTSGVLKTSGNQIELVLNKDSVLKFYKQADEQIVSILDLLLAPVFNDEVMTVQEYLETVGAFYGDAAAKELESSVLKVTLITPAGKKQVNVPFVEILTL